MEIGLHAQQLVAFVLIDRGDRHAGPLRDDFVDVALADDDAPRLDVELLARLPADARAPAAS